MNQSKQYVGVLTSLVEQQSKNGNFYWIGWIECPEISYRVSFHQKHLNRAELSSLKTNIFVLFELTTSLIPNRKDSTKTIERLEAINCSLKCDYIILKNIFQYDINTIKLIFRYATEELKVKIVSKIELVQKESPINEILIKIDNIKKIISGSSTVETKIEKLEEDIIPINEDVRQKTFLETIFETNTTEYNQNLFHVLVDGIKIIDSENIFDQAIFLLNFNNSLTNNKIENLNSIFYNKAIDKFKFRFWFEGITNYCSTDILKYHFENADTDLKSEIIKRCKGTENGFLVLNNNVKNSDEVEEVYFSGIGAKLVEELLKAKKKICVAVAWFTNDILFNTLCKKLDEGVKVELIIINDYINNWEFGLPFQNFVDCGGKLYFSESPSMMHHKFCLIDNEVIFNGSYNWTYYAEMRNNENIMLFKGKPNLMKAFKAEFQKLKLGNPIGNVTPFEKSQIGKFERIAFRHYFSNDLILRAETISQTNIIRANELASTAAIIDTENKEVNLFQIKIQPNVQLEERTIEAQNIIAEKQIISDNKIIKTLQNESTKPDINTLVNIPTTVQNENTKPDINPSVNIPTTVQNENTKPHINPSVNIPITVQNENTKPNINPSVHIQRPLQKKQDEQKNISSSEEIKQDTKIEKNVKVPPVIIKNYSIPQSNIKKYSYENLQLVFALDYSNSMENNGIGHTGYKLYSTGKIQKVIDMIFAISRGLTSEQDIDMFLFEIKSIRLPKITQTNYLNYVSQEIKKHEMNGTDIFAPIYDIHKNYINTSKNVFVILITDGENNEEASNIKIRDYFKNNTNSSIFWQFVGLGNKFDFLDSLEKIATNVSFFSLNDVQAISNEELLTRLLQKFPIWYNESQTKGLIK